jgi:ATP-dependent Zn protease
MARWIYHVETPEERFAALWRESLADVTEQAAAKAIRVARNLTSHDRHVLAIHEAGHVVVDRALGLPAFDWVSINPGPEHHAAGKVHRPQLRSGPMDRSRLKKEVTGYLAGAAAEERYTGAANVKAAECDLDGALELTARYATNAGDAEYQMLLGLDRARAIVNREWHIVEDVAHALLTNETMDYQDATMMMDSADLIARIGRMYH